MKIRFINPKIHGLLDYAAAAGLLTLPFLLDLGSQGPIALWLSVAGGVGLILYSLITDYTFGAAGLVPFKTHLALDLAAAAAFFAAPFAFGFNGLVAGYYFVMALGVVLVVVLSDHTMPDAETVPPVTAAPTNISRS